MAGGRATIVVTGEWHQGGGRVDVCRYGPQPGSGEIVLEGGYVRFQRVGVDVYSIYEVNASTCPVQELNKPQEQNLSLYPWMLEEAIHYLQGGRSTVVVKIHEKVSKLLEETETQSVEQ